MVWTALSTNFDQKDGERFVEWAVAHLKGLRGAERERAFDYIRKAPEEMNTPLRRALNWHGLI